MSPIDQLLTTVPEWCKVESKTKKTAIVTIRSKTNTQYRDVSLKINALRNGGLSVQETNVGTHFPKFCPERHINAGGTFCLFMGSQGKLKTNDERSAWWSSLLQFIENQEYAHHFQIWPLRSGLSHGDAANIQLVMEELVCWSGQLLKEVRTGIFRRKGWLGWILPRISRKGQFYNPTQFCPRGCRKSCKIELDANPIFCDQGSSRLPIRKCKNPRLLEKLVKLEVKRRRMEKIMIWNILGRKKSPKERKKICCGKMNICPIKDWREWG